MRVNPAAFHAAAFSRVMVSGSASSVTSTRSVRKRSRYHAQVIERCGIARTLLDGRFIRTDGTVKLIIAQRAIRLETTQSMGIATVEVGFWVRATAFEGALQGLDG